MTTSVATRRNLINVNDNTTIYSRVMDTLNKMGSANLATHDFGRTFHRKFDDTGKFGKYFCKDLKFTANIVAEVGSETEGTWLAAYPKKLPANKLPLNDSSTPHRMVIAARCPTGAPRDLTAAFGDFLAVADKVRGDDYTEEEATGEKFSNIVEWVVRSDGHPTEPGDIMLLRLPPTYEKPRNKNEAVEATPTKTRTRNKKSTDPSQDIEMSAANAWRSAVKERQIGDTYDPDSLPDHRGPYFAHQTSQLVQRDHRDEEDKLIAPYELYKTLTEGTLFSARISFETFVFKDEKFSSKIYHIYVERLKILDKGYGRAWNPPIPSLPSPSAPSTPMKRGREPEPEADKAVDDAFDNFKAISPKKNKMI
ncbi:hypothetical protein DFH09DRAFT_42866 [Mycena vulgaris]|nr:hypothetical protein DFH09DRAFT_42866 [Mycena vulgaris]